MAVPFCHPHRVSYAECTVGNHVYHSRYLDWLEAARGEFIRSLGPTVREWQERDVIFPVTGPLSIGNPDSSSTVVCRNTVSPASGVSGL